MLIYCETRNFDEWKLIWQSVTNQYTRIFSEDIKQLAKVYFVNAVAVKICQSFSFMVPSWHMLYEPSGYDCFIRKFTKSCYEQVVWSQVTVLLEC